MDAEVPTKPVAQPAAREPARPDVDGASLKSRIIHALRWTAAARFIGQILTWGSTLYVIRLLSPDDYGLVSMAMILLGLCALLNELGATLALIQTPEINDRMVRQVFGMVLIVNGLSYAAVYFGAPAYAEFFNAEGLVDVVRVLGLQLVIGAFAAVPAALLERDLRFKGYSIVELVATVVGALLTLALAVAGQGVWALVLGNLAQVVVRTVGIVGVTRFDRLPIFDFRGLRHILSFGFKISAQRIVWHVYSQADIFLIGKFLGAGAAGIYSVAFNLASLPMTKVVGILNQVSFPAYSRLQRDVAQVKSYYLRSIRIACALFFPVLWGLSAVAAPFVDLVLGETWREAAPVLQIVALTVPLRVIANLNVSLLSGLGRPGLNVINVLTSLVLVVAGLAIGFQWGLVGTAIGLAAGYTAGFAVNMHRSLPVIGCRNRELLAEMAAPAIAAAAMYAVVAAGREAVSGSVPLAVEFVALVLAGGLTYVGVLATLGRSTARDVVSLIKACF